MTRMPMTPILPNRSLLAWAAPAAPLAAMALPFYMLAPALYASLPGMTLAGVGLVIVAIRIIDAVAEIWLGVACDRLSPPLGRRRGILALAIVPAAAGAWCVFNPPATAVYAWLFLSSLALALGYTMATLAHTAWGAELAGSYNERTRFAAWREGLTIVGMLLALTPPALMANTASGVALVGSVVALALPILALRAIRLTPEPPNATIQRMDWRSGLRTLAHNSALKRLLAAWLLNGFANAIPATMFLYYVGSKLAAPALAGPLLLLYMGCAVLALPLVIALSKRAGKHQTWRVSMLVACAVFPWAAILGPDDIVLFGVICAITGFLLAFDLVLPAAIQADVADADLAISGEQRTGLLFAIWGAVSKLALALATGFAFAALAIFRFEPGAGQDGALSDGAGVVALGWLYACAPIIPKLLAIALMRDFGPGHSGATAVSTDGSRNP